MPREETIVALSTPMGESAIAVIRLSGPDCLELTQNVFDISHIPQARMAQVGFYKNLNKEAIDHCMYLLFPDARSYTGEPMLEIHTHGNPLIVQKIIEDIIMRGCRMANPGEFTRTAFENGKMDLSQAEAVADLIHARSQRAIHAAQKLLSGALARRVEELTNSLLNLIAQVEVYIDFPEDDLPEEDMQLPIKYADNLIREISALIRTHHYSALLNEGIKTIIIGAPNAGKSSLLNSLTGLDRAIVSNTPGTTRDFITEKIMIDPYCIQIMDTAGIHPTSDEIESMGIEKTVEKAQLADFYILVIDTTEPYPNFPEEIKKLIKPNNTLILLNKIDISKDFDTHLVPKNIPFLPISLKTGAGVDQLCEKIKETLEKDQILPNEHDIIVNARHAAAFERVKNHINITKERMESYIFDEITASELRPALDALTEVVGRIDNERMLDKLFDNFCIGK